jgi:hypothetical protein
MDSTTVKYLIEILEINPSWSLVVLTVLGGLIYFVIGLSKNTSLTIKIYESMNTLDAIRADQLKSNEERAKQSEEIKIINQRLTSVEEDMASFRCTNAPSCPNKL